ncbi:MAG: hypothetical protein RML93_05205, partial [Anaerolineales bacterium]|nr:hypothetical protein [Anaerolineales bacterium]MDW8446672.1 hypothetical protein [Anaerolineales bacterium]
TSLTHGTYLLALNRARGIAQTAAEHSRWQNSALEVEDLRRRWHRAWLDKAKLDASSRLRRWEDFLREYWQKPADQIDRYAYEARNRVILELLKEETPETLEIWDRLAQLDQRLRERWIQGEFLWEKEQAAQFPPAPYWFLWGRPL